MRKSSSLKRLYLFIYSYHLCYIFTNSFICIGTTWQLPRINFLFVLASQRLGKSLLMLRYYFWWLSAFPVLFLLPKLDSLPRIGAVAADAFQFLGPGPYVGFVLTLERLKDHFRNALRSSSPGGYHDSKFSSVVHEAFIFTKNAFASSISIC